MLSRCSTSLARAEDPLRNQSNRLRLPASYWRRRCGLLPPRGLVTRNHSGSWDTDAPVAAVYRHTDLGRLVVETLSRFWVWTALSDRAGADKGHRWNR